MSNGCRNTVLALGAESEVSRFVAFAVNEAGDEETTFTEQFETGVLYREPGCVRLEVVSNWEPPLKAIADVSCQFPDLRFAVEWEQLADGRYGCARIGNGVGEVVHLDEVIRLVCGSDHDNEDDEAKEFGMDLRWEIMRATSSHLCGEGWKDDGGPWGGASEVVVDVARHVAMQSVRERRDLAEEFRILQEYEQDALFRRSLLEATRTVPRRLGSQAKIRWQDEGF